MVALPTLDDVRLAPFRARAAEDRVVTPIEGDGRDAPFPVRRVFSIVASRDGLIGGRHAHRQCQQLIVCLDGVCEVACLADPDGPQRVVRLDGPAQGVLVPPGIWAEQRYLAPKVVLMVLCDQYYDEADYIRSFDDFRAFRAQG